MDPNTQHDSLVAGLALADLVDMIPVAIYVLDRDYTIKLWNTTAEHVYGWTKEEALGKRPLFIADFDDDALEVFRQAMGGHQLQDRELTRKHKSGRLVQISVSSKLLTDALGVASGVLVAAVDVTDQASLSQLLGNRLELIRGVIEALPNPVYFKNLAGQYLGINKAYEEMFALNRDQILGETVHDVFDNEQANLRSAYDQKLVQTGKSLWFDDKAFLHGNELQLQHHKALFYDQQGDPSGIVGVVTDTTALRALYKHNLVIEERLAFALQGSNLGMFDYEIASGTVSIDETTKAWGHFSDLVMPLKEALESFSPLSPAQFRTDLIALYKNKIRTFETEILITPANGDSRVLSLRGQVSHWSPDGVALRFTGTCADITEQKVKAQNERMRERQFALISQNIDELIVVTDRSSQVTYSSASAAKWFGSVERILNNKLEEFIHVDDKENFWLALDQIKESTPESTVRVRVQTGQADYRYTDFKLKRFNDDSQNDDSVLLVGRDVTHRVEMDARLERLAHYDQLTGVANRSLLLDRAEHALSRAKRFKDIVAVVFIDLDDFKRVNDSYGHAAGDELLKAIASRIKRALRTTDTVARQGGDEFILLLEDLQTPSQAKAVAERILIELKDPVDLGFTSIDVGASAGMALYPDDGSTVDELFAQADAAMYQAKATGKSRLEVYTAEIRAASLRRSKLEVALECAIAGGQFHLVYQPQLDLLTGQLVGVEALIRWTHPEYGVINPLDFIPVAEDTGVILSIGQWVLEEACRQTTVWQNAGLTNLRVAVNVSARQWMQADLALKVAQVIGSSGLPAHCLELELTESIVMKDLESSKVTMRWLQSMGVTFALDDFGTGYSSLSYLKRFELDVVKIDRSFTRDLPGDPNDVAIVKAILAMARGLGVSVIAEGIETQEQMLFLQQHGCDIGQGYFLDKPLLPKDFEAKYVVPSSKSTKVEGPALGTMKLSADHEKPSQMTHEPIVNPS